MPSFIYFIFCFFFYFFLRSVKKTNSAKENFTSSENKQTTVSEEVDKIDEPETYSNGLLGDGVQDKIKESNSTINNDRLPSFFSLPTSQEKKKSLIHQNVEVEDKILKKLETNKPNQTFPEYKEDNSVSIFNDSFDNTTHAIEELSVPQQQSDIGDTISVIELKYDPIDDSFGSSLISSTKKDLDIEVNPRKTSSSEDEQKEVQTKEVKKRLTGGILLFNSNELKEKLKKRRIDVDINTGNQDEDEERNLSPTYNVSDSPSEIPSIRFDKSEEPSDIDMTLDYPVDIQLLRHPNKDRPKGPAKRRPSLIRHEDLLVH